MKEETRVNFIDLILIALIAAGFFIGLKRGFILQIVHLLSFIVSFFVAYKYNDLLVPSLREWLPYPLENKAQEDFRFLWMHFFDFEHMYYAAISFFILFIGTKLLLHLLGHLLHLVALLPGLNFANRWLGAALGIVEVLLLSYLAVHVLLFMPWDTTHQWLESSMIVTWFVEETEVFSGFVYEMWKPKE